MSENLLCMVTGRGRYPTGGHWIRYGYSNGDSYVHEWIPDAHGNHARQIWKEDAMDVGEPVATMDFYALAAANVSYNAAIDAAVEVFAAATATNMYATAVANVDAQPAVDAQPVAYIDAQPVAYIDAYIDADIDAHAAGGAEIEMRLSDEDIDALLAELHF